MSQHSISFSLLPQDNRRLANLCGEFDAHLRLIEQRLSIKIHNRGNEFKLIGDPDPVNRGAQILKSLYEDTLSHTQMTADYIHLALQEAHVAKTEPNSEPKSDHNKHPTIFQTKKGAIRPRTTNQKLFVERIAQHAINFGIGPAGTGKTFMAVACAVAALEKDAVSRILLVRPVVEAGESLGFLPGDYIQKIDPYLRPLYDSLHDLLGGEKVEKLLEREVIEIAPLAYMRGRTLSDSFIILDESQNCTKEQMKMFLTRIGFGSTAVITGDITQVDLPRTKFSGLRHAMQVLSNIPGISFTHFDHRDVVRHPLIEAIIQAYTAAENQNNPEGRL